MQALISTLIVAAGLAVAFNVAPASAQTFNGDCKAHASSKEACLATQWCAWVEGKPLTLPNGQTVTRANQCRFKPGHKAGWQAVAKQ